jgi:hypothetical protein
VCVRTLIYVWRAPHQVGRRVRPMRETLCGNAGRLARARLADPRRDRGPIYRPKDAQPYPECRSCAAAPRTVAKAVQYVKAAKKRMGR